MKHPSISKRSRSRGYSMESVRLFAGSCIFIIVCGNLVMLQTYHAFVNRHSGDDVAFDSDDSSHDALRPRRDIQRDIVQEFASEFLPKLVVLPQYSGIEGRVRKLMQENTRSPFLRKMGVASITTSRENGYPLASLINHNTNNMLIKDQKDMLTCEDVDRLQNLKRLGSGITKVVYRASLGGQDVAVKTVNVGGRSVSNCVGQGFNMSECYGRAAYKIVKEIVVLQALAGVNVVKVLGYCVPTQPFDNDVDTAVAMVTELGEPIDQIKLLQMSWEDRLRISMDITKLMNFLSKTPFGSVSLNDFRRAQFVMVNGSLKLSDVDDAGFGDPVCQQNKDCVIDMRIDNRTKRIRCTDGVCRGYNEYMNIMKAGKHFTSFLLPHGAPKSLRPMLDKIVAHFNNLTATSAEMVRDLTKVVNLYTSGAYLGRPKNNMRTDYQYYSQSDYPGQFDYSCRFSMSGGVCTLAVFDVQEAEEVCSFDDECRGFVWSHRKTWTGRTLVHLKNGIGRLSWNKETDMYIKPS